MEEEGKRDQYFTFSGRCTTILRMSDSEYQSRFRSTLDAIADAFDTAQTPEKFESIGRALLNIVSVVSSSVMADFREHLDDQGKNMDTLGCVNEMAKRITGDIETRRDFTNMVLTMLVDLHGYWAYEDPRTAKLFTKLIRQLRKHPDISPNLRQKAEKDFG